VNARSKLAERIAGLEKRIAEAQERMNAPQVAMPAGMEMCAKEVMPVRPSKAERRARLIAAHVALEAVRHDLGDYAEYQAINVTQTSIAAAIGRLELRD
jgi:hypothetical protein